MVTNVAAASVDCSSEGTLESSQSWFESWFRWCPTSMSLLRSAESKILRFLQTPYEGRYVNIGNILGGSECKIWTLLLNQQSREIPLVLLHGFASGVALWCLNLDKFAEHRPVYAMDLLGFGRSSRPRFSNDALEVESQIVLSIEEWRKALGLEKFILLGHSMGGFLASAYALQHPNRVASLILADPWGFPDRPVGNEGGNNRPRIPLWVKGIAYMLQPFNPLWILRVSGPMGPRLVKRARPDIFQKFTPLVEDADSVIADYIYHCNAQNPTGESAFHAMMKYFGWAKFPMMHRIPSLRCDVPITFIYGARSWVDSQPGLIIKDTRPNVNLHVIKGAGHHLYADRCEEFNNRVREICQGASVPSA